MDPNMNRVPPPVPPYAQPPYAQPPYTQPPVYARPPMPGVPPTPPAEDEERRLTRGAIIAIAAIVGIVAYGIGIAIGWLFSGLFGMSGRTDEKTQPPAVTENTTVVTEVHSVDSAYIGTWETTAVVDGKRARWSLSVKNLPMETVVFSLFRDGEAVFDGMTASLVNNGAMFGVLDPTSGKTQTGMLLFENETVRVRVMDEWSSEGKVLWEVLFDKRSDPNPQWTAATTVAPLVKPERYASRYWYDTNDADGVELAVGKADYISVEFSLWDGDRLVIDRGEALWVNPNTAAFLYHDGDGTVQGQLVFESQRMEVSIDVTTSRLCEPASWTLNASSAQSHGRYPTTTVTTTTKATTAPTARPTMPAGKRTVEKEIDGFTVCYPEYERGENGEYTVKDVKLERKSDTQVQITYRICFTNGVEQTYAVYRFLDADGALLAQTQTAYDVQLNQSYSRLEVLTIPEETARIELYMSR